jgi:hypothetical protein
MISEQELREIMEQMGFSPEQIAATVETRNYLEDVRKKIEEMAELLTRYMRDALGEVLGMLEEYACEIVPPKKEKPRRPPRCIGPKNKAPRWVPRPARVARSSCRKIKRR